jgi:cytochrome c oxidase cbb3-type subunit III
MTDHRDIDELSGIDTTGHDWDGIKELNNPLPRWWLWTLYASLAWGLAYCIAYPAWPLINSATQGALGWSSRGDIAKELADADAAKAVFRDKIATMSVKDVLADAKMRAFAVSAGASLFKVNCVQCHGSGAQGGAGYPNLNDDSWIWGGTPEQIELTIAHGVRDTASDETRASEMPAFGREQILTPAQVSESTEHVLSLAKLEHDAAKAKVGEKIYADNCASCHGERGEGNIELGAPQLNDAIWLYGGTRSEIARQVNAPRHGMMPHGWRAWVPRK